MTRGRAFLGVLVGLAAGTVVGLLFADKNKPAPNDNPNKDFDSKLNKKFKKMVATSREDFE